MAKTKLHIFHMGLYGVPTRHMFKMASPAVTWMSSSKRSVRDLDKSIT